MHNKSVASSENQMSAPPLRYDWSTGEILKIYELPLLDLLYKAHTVHKKCNNNSKMQLASLLNIKTGSCPEDCKYCSQSAHYAKTTNLKSEKLMELDSVIKQARIAKSKGAARFCIGAAWRNIPDDKSFQTVLKIVKEIRSLKMEACATLGMLNESQAKDLAEAGLTAYNHNLDTSPEFYGKIISTRKYADRLKTIENVRSAGITVCSGGIIGLGETKIDRIGLIKSLAKLKPHPESIPINTLVPIKGTPLEQNKPVRPIDLVRLIATTRIVMPKSRIRLSAGRSNLSEEAQVMCFFAGANSIFYGEKLLTTENNIEDEDLKLLEDIGIEHE